MAVVDESCTCQEGVASKSLLIAKEFFKKHSHFLRNAHVEKAGEKVDSSVMMDLADVQLSLLFVTLWIALPLEN